MTTLDFENPQLWEGVGNFREGWMGMMNFASLTEIFEIFQIVTLENISKFLYRFYC